MGSLEHTTIYFFGVLPACRFEKTAARMSLGQRIKIIDEVLALEKDEVHVEALKALRAAAKLLTDRNLVAHNGTTVDVFQDGDRLLLTAHLQSYRSKKLRLSLKEMRARSSARTRLPWTSGRHGPTWRCMSIPVLMTPMAEWEHPQTRRKVDGFRLVDTRANAML